MRQIEQGGNGWGWWKTASAVCLLCAGTAITSPAQTFDTLLSFDYTDGAYPLAGLVQGTDGNFYGTTSSYGANSQGTIFKITPSGTLTTLYSFCSQSNCADGQNPHAGLVQASNGDFYGTTLYAGKRDGTVFKVTPSGTLTTLYRFCSLSGCTDGEYPEAGLVQGSDGSFYGTTSLGGSYINGTIFKITPSGTLTTLYAFSSHGGCPDGCEPEAGLIQATDGSFYGTTPSGGANGGGTVFKITPKGALTTLYSFCSQVACVDGQEPVAGLLQASDGNFYGTTESGGANGHGTVFKVTPSGTLTTLYSFCSESGCTDGIGPEAGLIQGTDGSLYGTTYYGGANGNYGTVFKITLDGTSTTLYSFCSQSLCADGQNPQAALVQDTNGNFYGTASFGGADYYGTVFSLSVGLGPFVETQPTSGKVGRLVKILGTDLTGATSVVFNGTTATFTVVSSSLIKTNVPTGATSGTVQVVTPGGALLSNVPFRVIP